MSNGRIFISYSHRGDGPQWKTALLRSLQVFEQHHLLDVWQDGKIRISSFWDDDIKQAMGSAQVAVLLLTKEVLESEYILNTEFPLLRERQKEHKLPVFPVICEECDWREHDWLRATQAPNESNPLSPLSEAARDRIFRQLAADIAETLSRVALAELPQTDQAFSHHQVYLDKFPLSRTTGLREEKLIGREQELALLDLAFAQPHTAIVSLVAWGGVGKTMLVQHWLQRLEREGWFGARRVYAWSFYSQGTSEDRQASEDTFLAHALEWFGVQCEPTLSPWDKGRLLADAVARERTLLILDGIEPLQYPPGPMGGQLRAPGVQALLKQLARKATHTEHRGLCLVTTREPLTDLADFQRRPEAAWGSVLRVDLGNLTEVAAAVLLHHAGAKRAGAAEITADDAELLSASREVDGHALTLNLLARFLARAHSGDIRRRDLVKFEEADRSVQGGTTFKMLAAFENWFAKSGEFGARQLAVLRILGLFEGPADAGCIAALRKPPVIAGLTDPLFGARTRLMGLMTGLSPIHDENWNLATSFLADCGLVWIQNATEGTQNTAIDCHPLLREHFAKQLRGGTARSWRLAHHRLYKHLCATAPQRTKVSAHDQVMLILGATEESDQPLPTLEDLQPLYQAVEHGCKAGLQQRACVEVYRDRIQRGQEGYTTHKLGALGSDLGAVACFFEKPWSRLLPAIPEAAQAWLLNEAAYRLRALGRLGEALEPMRAAMEMAAGRKDWTNAASGTSNLSELELTMGEVAAAVEYAEQSVTYADLSGNAFQRVADRGTLADALHQMGRQAAAETLFVEAEAMQAERGPDYPLLCSADGFFFCDLLLAAPERAGWQRSAGFHPRDTMPQEFESGTATLLASCRAVSQRAAQTVKIAEQNNWLLDIGLHHLTLGRAALYEAILEGTSLDPCRTTLQDSVDDLNRASDLTYLPHSLLTRAWLRFLERDFAQTESVRKECENLARSDLVEAWDIAERGPMRLHLADIHLYRARLFFREKPYPWKSPEDDLAAAENLINDCGYHRRDEELADAKKAILVQVLM